LIVTNSTFQNEKRRSKEEIVSNSNHDYNVGRGRQGGDKVGSKKNGLFFNWKRFSTSNSNNNNKLRSEERKIEKESQVWRIIKKIPWRHERLHNDSQECIIWWCCLNQSTDTNDSKIRLEIFEFPSWARKKWILKFDCFIQ